MGYYSVKMWLFIEDELIIEFDSSCYVVCKVIV